MPSTNVPFTYRTMVFLGDTNAEGNVYWTNYYKWFGQAREVFLASFVPSIKDLLASGLLLVTVETSIKHFQSLFLFDQVRLDVMISDITRVSLRLKVDFYKEDTASLVAQGWQKIACTNPQGKIDNLPEEIVVPAKQFLICDKASKN